MVERYPHTLAVQYTLPGSYDSDGDYQIGTAVDQEITGRAEANSKGDLIRLEDGSQIVYSWVFYCEPIDYDIPYGAAATLTHNTGTWRGTIKRSAVNQRGTQIWV